jgi:hypothetical protein
LFCEVVIAAEYDAEQLRFYKKRKQNYFSSNEVDLLKKQVRSCLNGLIQERNSTDNIKDLKNRH